MPSSVIAILTMFFLIKETNPIPPTPKPRVIVSTDIGGRDPDDYQSLIHFLLYADRFNIEGLISSPPHEGTLENIIEVISAYERDFEKLRKKNADFPSPELLRNISKQGAENAQTSDVPENLSEGAEWIIQQARKPSPEPLYILVWGSMTDIAEALHQAPDIKKKIRIYSIGSWNTDQDPKSRDYVFNHHQDVWWIENNSTFRGMYLGGEQNGDWGNLSFVLKFVKGKGNLGNLFYKQKPDIKMGDTPSVLYLLNGDPDRPEGESWGGSFRKLGSSYWTDKEDPFLEQDGRAGAKTVNRHRMAFLQDWALRMSWLD